MRTRDHKEPLSRGGANDLRNLVWCCYDCNQDKADLTLDEKTSDIKVGEAYAVGTSREYGQKRAVVVDTSAEEPEMRFGRRTGIKKGVRVKWEYPAPWMDKSGTSVVSPREVQEPWDEFVTRRARIDAQRREAYEQKRARREHAERLAEKLRGLGCDAFARANERIEISVADAERIANVLSGAEEA